jgi:UDP-N-acetylmuramoylalanine--D-glutamate ligase
MKERNTEYLKEGRLIGASPQTPHTPSFERAPELAPGMPLPLAPGDLAVVVGAGSSGVAAARLLLALGTRVRLLDQNAAISESARELIDMRGLTFLSGEHSPEQFAGARLVVSSPGVPPARLAPLLREAGNPPLIAELELALRFTREPILAVTGTSGKTTTASLAAAMLEAGGKKTFLGGNIGTPLSDYVLGPERADALVLETSSFQLQGTEHLHPRAAILLNLSANHLDHHRDMDEYAAAKFRLFSRQSAEDLALLPEVDELVAEYRRQGFAARLAIFGPTGRFPQTRLLGRHNAANAEAAWLACREFGVSEEEAERAVAAFMPLRHRLEKAGEVNSVLYVNDSKSTTVDALAAALQSFAEPVLLLAGGKFKGGDLAGLRALLRERVKAVALFGASRDIFARAWEGSVPLFWDADLPTAVTRLRSMAEAGDVVLLSPATSSFDLYANYKARGDHFCALVREMQAPGPDGDRS